MILVPCPYCGPRNASEFRWGGEIKRRPDPNNATTEQWRDYLYFRRNPAGWITETWCHQAGCGRYFRSRARHNHQRNSCHLRWKRTAAGLCERRSRTTGAT